MADLTIELAKIYGSHTKVADLTNSMKLAKMNGSHLVTTSMKVDDLTKEYWYSYLLASWQFISHLLASWQFIAHLVRRWQFIAHLLTSCQFGLCRMLYILGA